MKNGLTAILCSWKRRGESSHGYCTSTPGSAPPSISVPCTLKTKSPPGMRTMPAGASAAGLVGGISTMLCGRTGPLMRIAGERLLRSWWPCAA